MCTAATYKTKDFYFGRTLDYEFSYGDEVVITPRNYPFHFRHIDAIESHYAMIGMAHVVDNDPLYYDAFNAVFASSRFAQVPRIQGINSNCAILSFPSSIS